LNRLLQREGAEGVINLLTSSGVACDRQDWTQILQNWIEQSAETSTIKDFRQEILNRVGVDTYRSWFKDLEISATQDRLLIQGETAFKVDTLSAQHRTPIAECCSALALTPEFSIIN
jgi:chromosomal replication initiation ATPase DnaA